jgi:hypothetical protein
VNTILVSDRFTQALKPARRNPDKVPVEDLVYVEMLWRMIRALEFRAIENPEMLTQIYALGERLAEMINVVIATNAERFARNPHTGASMAECGRVLGITKQSASERKARGLKIIAERIREAGVVPHRDAEAEKAAVKAAKAAELARERTAIANADEHAVVNLATWRERRAA